MLLLHVTDLLADVIANVADVIATSVLADVIYQYTICLVNSIEQHFPQTWKKPGRILAKACLTAKNFVLFMRNL